MLRFTIRDLLGLTAVVALACVCSPAQAVIKVFVEVPHDDSVARDVAKKLPEASESSLLLLLVERLATSDRSQVRKEVRFPYNYENLSREHIEKRLGKPIDFKPSNYARPCAGSELVLPDGVQRRDSEGFMERSKYYELKGVGGVIVFYSAEHVAISPAVAYLRTDDDFVALTTKDQAPQRLAWETQKLRKLKDWLGIPEDVAKNDQGEFRLTGRSEPK